MNKIIKSVFGDKIGDLVDEFARTHTHILIPGSLIGFFSFSLDSLVTPRILSNIFTEIKDPEVLKINIIKLVIVWFLTQTSYILTENINIKIEPSLTKFITDKIIQQLFVKYESLNISLDLSTIINRISLLSTNIEELIDKILNVLVPRIFQIFILIINFFILNKKIGILIFILCMLQLKIILSNINTCVDKAYKSVENKDIIYQKIFDKIENIHIISSIKGSIDKEIKNNYNDSETVKNERILSNKCVMNKQAYSYTSNIILFTCVLTYIYKLFKQNEISPKTITIILLTIDKLFNQMYELSYFIPIIIKKVGILNSNKKFVDELFSHQIKTGKDIIINNGSVKFENVSFNYPNSSPLFTNLNLDVPANSKYVIFGKSGTGKSSLVKLLLGILTPTSGNIYIDNINIKDFNRESIKKYITYISQNTSTLFDSTILENITYGYDNIDIKILQNKIIDIMTKYNLLSVYKKLIHSDNIQDFFDYKVGKRGDNLSGGQKQLIYLIRSCLNDETKILILDEPTSALDIETRDDILNLLLLQNKTIIIITHDQYIKNKFVNKLILD